MLRKRGQKSLYEAISSAKQKAVASKPPAATVRKPDEPAQPLPPQQREAAQEQQEAVEQRTEERAAASSGKAEKRAAGKHNWPTRPKSIAFIDGRLELSLSYTIAVVIGLVLILIVLLFFRLGQIYGSSVAGQKKGTVRNNLPPAEGLGIQAESVNPALTRLTATTSVSETTGRGSNRIVIKTYGRSRDLEPVKEFFDKNGIETEIVQDNAGSFKLVTKNRNYSNPNVSGTNGFEAKQKIIEIGRGYKAPQGYEQFRFDDPYGEKVQ
jgi:hypothetical protein